MGDQFNIKERAYFKLHIFLSSRERSWSGKIQMYMYKCLITVDIQMLMSNISTHMIQPQLWQRLNMWSKPLCGKNQGSQLSFWQWSMSTLARLQGLYEKSSNTDYTFLVAEYRYSKTGLVLLWKKFQFLTPIFLL